MKRFSTFIIIIALITTISCFRTSAESGPSVSAPSALLMEQSTGKVLFEKNADEKRAPASVTKIMTLLLIMEALEEGVIAWDTPISVSSAAAGMGGSQVYLKEGETMTVEEMIKCIAVVSANDCCVAMAEHLSGSVASFIEEMNIRAKELGMENTRFNSCTGLDTEEHYTTARDIALMSRELMQHEQIQNYTTIWMDSVRNGSFSLSNTNKLVRYYEGATGLKTGYTSSAGYCLSATATRDGLSLIAVVLGAESSSNRFDDAKALLNHGFSKYSLYCEQPQLPGPVNVVKGTEKTVAPIPSEAPLFLIPKGSEKDITYRIDLPETVHAPVDPKQRLGRIDYLLNGEIIGSIDLLAEKEVPFIGFWQLFFQLIQYFFAV